MKRIKFSNNSNWFHKLPLFDIIYATYNTISILLNGNTANWYIVITYLIEEVILGIGKNIRLQIFKCCKCDTIVYI